METPKVAEIFGLLFLCVGFVVIFVLLHLVGLLHGGNQTFKGFWIPTAVPSCSLCPYLLSCLERWYYCLEMPILLHLATHMIAVSVIVLPPEPCKIQ